MNTLKQIEDIINSFETDNELNNWIIEQVKNEDVIVNRYFAAQLISSYKNCFPREKISKITVYALKQGSNPFIEYQIVKSFDNIKWEKITNTNNTIEIKVSSLLQIAREIQTNYNLKKQNHRVGLLDILDDIYVENNLSWNNIDLNYTTIPTEKLNSLLQGINEEWKGFVELK